MNFLQLVPAAPHFDDMERRVTRNSSILPPRRYSWDRRS